MCCKFSKFWTAWLNHSIMCRKDVAGMANRVAASRSSRMLLMTVFAIVKSLVIALQRYLMLSTFSRSVPQCIWSMDLLDPFSCQLHHIAFDRLKSHTPFPCPGTQSINIPLKFYCVFFILNFTIANTVIRKKSYFRLNIWCLYVQREQQGTNNGALRDTRQNRSPVRLYSIYKRVKHISYLVSQSDMNQSISLQM